MKTNKNSDQAREATHENILKAIIEALQADHRFELTKKDIKSFKNKKIYSNINVYKKERPSG